MSVINSSRGGKVSSILNSCHAHFKKVNYLFYVHNSIVTQCIHCEIPKDENFHYITERIVKSRDISVGIATRLGAERSEF
jgi:hypothetical protein